MRVASYPSRPSPSREKIISIKSQNTDPFFVVHVNRKPVILVLAGFNVLITYEPSRWTMLDKLCHILNRPDDQTLYGCLVTNLISL